MNFEDLDIWKRATRLSIEIYKALKDLKDYGFRDQITRASLSIPSNVAEGFERQSEKAIEMLGPRPAEITVKQMLSELNGT